MPRLLPLVLLIAATLLASVAGASSTTAADADSADPAIDVAREHRAGKEMRRRWRDYSPKVEFDRKDILWAGTQLRHATGFEALGLDLMIVGLGSALLGELLGIVVKDLDAQLAFSIAAFSGLVGGGVALLASASFARRIHRRWATGPLWGGRITGMVLLGLAGGSALVAIGGSIHAYLDPVAAGGWAALGDGFAFYLGLPAMIVLIVDIVRHRRPIRGLEFVRERAARPAVLPIVRPIAEGAVVGLAGRW